LKATKIGAIKRLSDEEVKTYAKNLLDSLSYFSVQRKTFFGSDSVFDLLKFKIPIHEVSVPRSDLTPEELEQKQSDIQEMYSYPHNYEITWTKDRSKDIGQPIDQFTHEIETESRGRPILLEHYWLYDYTLYTTLLDSESEELLLLVKEQESKKTKKLEKLRKLVAVSVKLEKAARREHIPEEVQMFVWRRDGAKCVKCGSQENLEFDHIIPLSKDGANTAWNIQLLCEACNRAKSDTI